MPSFKSAYRCHKFEQYFNILLVVNISLLWILGQDRSRQYERPSMELSVSAGHFQSVIIKIFAGKVLKEILVYVDEIFIY